MSCEFYNKTNSGLCAHYINNFRNIGLCSLPDMFLCAEDLKKRLPMMSHSSRIDFIHCRRKYYYRKIQGLQVKKRMLPEPVKLGIIWDKFLEDKYNG